MRIGNINQGRPAYYDRNPMCILPTYDVQNVAPHGITQRWIYTVPAQKKAYNEGTVVQIIRRTAAAPASTVQFAVSHTPFGGASGTLANCRIYSNGVSDQQSMFLSALGLMTQGDDVKSTSADVSTGGTVDYVATVKITEFDG